mmetsp:Transcript_123602/g.311309  ORF Transcript_123602/g.311309 Transcript_123602/m.311309 type:complete len:218 (+) Transcript_123602:1156-1809(+)
MCDKLWAENVWIFAKHSPAIALTNCSFQRPHLENAQAVLDKCLWSKPSILLTTSAAMTDMSASLRTPSEAKPHTMPAISCGLKFSARYFEISAILCKMSTTMLSSYCNLPKAKAMSERSLGDGIKSEECNNPYNLASKSRNFPRYSPSCGLLKTPCGFNTLASLNNPFVKPAMSLASKYSIMGAKRSPREFSETWPGASPWLPYSLTNPPCDMPPPP